MVIETIVATIIGVIVSRVYIEHYYILIEKSGIVYVNLYDSNNKFIRTIHGKITHGEIEAINEI